MKAHEHNFTLDADDMIRCTICNLTRLQVQDRERKDRHNAARRERHAAMTDLGLKRVRGALGGVYYE